MSNTQKRLSEISAEIAAKKAAIDAEQERLVEALRLENEARIAAEKAATEAKAVDAAKAAKAAEEAAKASAKAKKALEKELSAHASLFPSTASAVEEDDVDEPPTIWDQILDGWNWFQGCLPTVVTIFLVVIVAWAVVWAYFGLAYFVGSQNLHQVTTEPTAVAEAEAEVVAPQEQPTKAPEATAVPEATVPASKPKPKPKPKATAPAVLAPTEVPPPPPAPAPINWDSVSVNPSGTADYAPVDGMICWGDVVGPWGDPNGLSPVIHLFVGNQKPMKMVWAHCEWGTGRTADMVKPMLEKQYNKKFTIVP